MGVAGLWKFHPQARKRELGYERVMSQSKVMLKTVYECRRLPLNNSN